MKKRIQTIIPISPIATKLPLILHTDASNVGFGWVWTQLRDTNCSMDECYKEQQVILEMGSASLTEAQRKYAPIEQELLSIVTACKKLDSYCRYTPRVYIYTDCSPLVALHRKDFSEIKNPRILRLMEKLVTYNLELRHIPGSRNKMADYLSRYSN